MMTTPSPSGIRPGWLAIYQAWDSVNSFCLVSLPFVLLALLKLSELSVLLLVCGTSTIGSLGQGTSGFKAAGTITTRDVGLGAGSGAGAGAGAGSMLDGC